MTEALKASHTEARTTVFKAEVVEKEIVHLKDEVEANSLCEKELAVRETRRAYMKGKKDVADIVKKRFTWVYERVRVVEKDVQLYWWLPRVSWCRWRVVPSTSSWIFLRKRVG